MIKNICSNCVHYDVLEWGMCFCYALGRVYEGVKVNCDFYEEELEKRSVINK